jgi:hypothetical protein
MEDIMEGKILRHVVLFKFIEQTSQEKIEEIENAFISLKSKIEIIKDIEWGTDVSIEGISQGFTHCFLVTFDSAEDRDKYIPHPDHQAFSNSLKPYLEKVCVIDYWAKH